MRIVPLAEHRELTPAQTRFIACCAELAWNLAAEALRECAPLTFAQLASRPDLSSAFQEFAHRASETEISEVRAALEEPAQGDPELPVDGWRTRAMALLSNAHLRVAGEHLDAGRFGEAHAQTVAALVVRGRTPEHELLLTGGFQRLARAVGRLESVESVAVHQRSGTCPTGYTPELLPDILERLVDAGASDAALSRALESIVLNADWPSIRALIRSDARYRAVLVPILEKITARRPELATHAQQQLLALAAVFRRSDADAAA
jgi:hypothetical protein